MTANEQVGNMQGLPDYMGRFSYGRHTIVFSATGNTGEYKDFWQELAAAFGEWIRKRF